jgi:serine/threonine-protein kinase
MGDERPDDVRAGGEGSTAGSGMSAEGAASLRGVFRAMGLGASGVERMMEEAAAALERLRAEEAATPDAAETVAHEGGSASGDEAEGVRGEPGRFLRGAFHAKGGLGWVYRGYDTHLEREVAYKEVQSRYLGDETARRRLVREARTTGTLEHPAIVPVYGLGTDEAGRPYYVMRFVRGTTLADAVAAHRAAQDGKAPAAGEGGPPVLTLPQLLRRFLDVCNAADYAHSRDVIHRDIKPSNVMLGPFGETLLVDWGLARRVGRDDAHPDEPELAAGAADGVELTAPGGGLGTPGYMSPEQCVGSDAATRPTTDVYGLGATLYHVLTGRKPYLTEAECLAGRIKPPRAIDPTVPRALEAICLKALALRPEDRYVSARELATDVERWLDDEPVLARREPALERAGRWVRRHRGAVMTALASSVTLGMILAGATILLADSNHRLNQANGREQQARETAQQQRDAARENFEIARNAVDRYFTKVSQDRLLNEPQLEGLRLELLSEARDFYEQLIERESTDPELAMDVASAYHTLGQIKHETGDIAEAIRLTEESVRRIERLCQARPEDVHSRLYLALFLENLAGYHVDGGRADEAERILVEAVAKWEELLDSGSPDLNMDRVSGMLAICRSNLASVYVNTSRTREAETIYRRIIADADRRLEAEPADERVLRQKATAHMNLAVALRNRGETAESEREAEVARAAFAQLNASDPGSREYRVFLARASDLLGEAIRSQPGREEEARLRFEEGIQVLEGLVADFPLMAVYRHSLANALNNYARFHLQQTMDYERSEGAFRRAMRVLEELARSDPSNHEHIYELAMSKNDLGGVLMVTGRVEEAEALLEEAVAMRDRLYRDHPERPGYGSVLGVSILNLALAATRQGKFDLASERLERARGLLLAVLERDRDDATAQGFLEYARAVEDELSKARAKSSDVRTSGGEGKAQDMIEVDVGFPMDPFAK